MDVSFIKKISADTATKGVALQSNPFSLLPLGDILCREGWLYEQLRLMSQGITGRLHEYGPYFRPDRNGFLYPNIRKGWEEIPYWLRGFYPLAVLLNDQNMLEIATAYIEAIFESADEDGWFGPAYLKAFAKTDNGADIPDLYPNMMLADTLTLYYDHTKDERVLRLLGAYFQFCLSLSNEQFLPPIDNNLRWQKIRAGDMLEPIYWYYRKTKDSHALSLATRVHRAIARSTSGYVATHAVDFSQRFAYDAIYSQQSGKKEHFDRSEFEYQKYKAVWGQMPRGIFAADEQIRNGAIDPRQSFEPCGIVELAKNFYSLTRISGDTIYADRTEDLMLNHFAACFTPDYKQIRYLTSANGPILTNYTKAATYNGSKSHDRSYQLMTPNNRCCGHNTGMGWPWYTLNLWQKTYDGGLAANLYAPCEIHTEIEDKPIALTVRTDYPFTNRVDVEIGFSGRLPIYFRIPSWCRSCMCTIDGKEVWNHTQNGGWLKILREWKSGEVLTLVLGMELSLTQWSANGSVSVDMGPLTYSVRIKEKYRVPTDALSYNHPEPHLWDNYEILPDSPWNYGLVEGGDIRIASIEKPARQPFDEKNPPIVLQATAKRIPEWQLQDSCAEELQQSPVYCDQAEEMIEMIPMGCARLRITCLPVVTDDPTCPKWKNVPSHMPLDRRPVAFSQHFDFHHVTTNDSPWKPDDE